MSDAPVIWTVEDILKATDGRTAGGEETPFRWISHDSRDLRKDSLFVALKGAKTDGHHFVKDALAAGAKAALVQMTPAGVPADDPRLIYVKDTMDALNDLARTRRAASDATFVAITGSAGKTGTKEALHRALAADRFTHASEKSFNNHVGLPLSLARMPLECAYGVFELGMNAPGEIDALARLLRPHLALITAVGGAHRAAFDSEDDIARAKAEVFPHLEGGKIAVLDRDGPYFPLLEAHAQEAGATIRTHSATGDERADTIAIKVARQPDCSCFTADVMGDLITYKISLPGTHWVRNSLAVMTTVKALGADTGLAGLALADMKMLPGRGAQYRVTMRDGAFTLIDESYNANPLSMAAALSVLGESERPTRRARRIAVFADMRELGKTSDAMHLALEPALRDAEVDCLFALGPRMSRLQRQVHPDIRGGSFKAQGDLIAALQRTIRPGDTVLVKGANAAGLSAVVDALLAGNQDDGENGGTFPDARAHAGGERSC